MGQEILQKLTFNTSLVCIHSILLLVYTSDDIPALKVHVVESVVYCFYTSGVISFPLGKRGACPTEKKITKLEIPHEKSLYNSGEDYIFIINSYKQAGKIADRQTNIEYPLTSRYMQKYRLKYSRALIS